MSVELLHGDCLDVLRTLPDASVDAMATDPPAGIEFMGKEWDSFRQGRFAAYRRQPGSAMVDGPPTGVMADKGFKYALPSMTQKANPRCVKCRRYRWDHVGRKCECKLPQWEIDTNARATFIAYMTVIFAECLRVLKPGAHAVVWALPRTSHWTATALEDAGFEVRDCLSAIFGSGFPKSRSLRDIGRPELGTALKPAVEFWWLIRKPLSESTVAANVLAHGTGGINVDGCRVGAGTRRPLIEGPPKNGADSGKFRTQSGYHVGETVAGRWPANLLLSHAEGCEPVGTRKVANHGSGPGHRAGLGYESTAQGDNGYERESVETVDAWRCVEGCPVRLLDEQSGERPASKPGTTAQVPKFCGGIYNPSVTPQKEWGYGDTGGASRFFPTFRYEPKADRGERDEGCEALPPRVSGKMEDDAYEWETDGRGNPRSEKTIARNHHPTVKPVALMRWLCRLITPPHGLVLDPFMGSGTTGVACAAEDFRFLGIEREAEYFAIAEARIRAATAQPSLFGPSEEAVA